MGVPVLLPNGGRKTSQQRVHSSFVTAHPYLQPVNSPGRSERQILTRAAKHHELVAGPRTNVAESGEGSTIAAVRRRRQEDNISRLAGECRHGRVTIAVAGDTMRFVDDNDVPPAVGRSGQ